jgi:UDP-glucose-4-epimerase GalE
LGKRRVLLVGGAGYIGAHCAQTLHDAGMETVVYDDLSTGIREAAVGPLVVGNVLDRPLLLSVLREGRFDAVMHFAARLLVPESVVHPLSYFDTNVAGTVSLLQAMAEAGPRVLVFSSTCATYGDPRYLPIDEAHPNDPVNPYGMSKLMVERILAQCREREGFRITALRYFNASGCHPSGSHGESHVPETHLIPLTLDAASGGPPLVVFGNDYPTPDGTCIRDYVHVCDIADAHMLALEAMWTGALGKSYNLGTGTGTTVLEIIQAVEQVSGRKVNYSLADRRPGDPPALYASAKLIQTELGWSPRFVDLRETIETAWRWFENPRYGRPRS